jgi:hypothetical protein
MGSELAASFDEAFFDYPGAWSADWTHTRDYVDAAAKVLDGINADAWTKNLKEAIWSRDAERRDALCKQAREHRVDPLPAGYEKCPVAAVTTYLRNNWRYMHFADNKAQGLPIGIGVSARAEAQVPHNGPILRGWRLARGQPRIEGHAPRHHLRRPMGAVL